MNVHRQQAAGVAPERWTYRPRVPDGDVCDFLDGLQDGDDIAGGLDTPEAFADFALQCKERGYPAFKLHTWQPPIPGAGYPTPPQRPPEQQ